MATASQTIAEALGAAADRLAEAGLESPRRDAEVLLGFALGLSRAGLYAAYPRGLSDDEMAAIERVIQRRSSCEPVAYIVGRKEFWSLELEVGPGVLIPRPETEVLVEAALAESERSPPTRLLDLGTGSGAVAIALGWELSRRGPANRIPTIVASDTSEVALAYARKNRRRHGLGHRVELRQGDLFEVVAPGERFDLVVANPPYVTQSEHAQLAPDVRQYEPADALVAGTDGLAIIRRLIAEAPRHLTRCGVLLFEHGADQARSVADLLHTSGFGRWASRRDLAGRPRVAVAWLVA